MHGIYSLKKAITEWFNQLEARDLKHYCWEIKWEIEKSRINFMQIRSAQSILKYFALSPTLISSMVKIDRVDVINYLKSSDPEQVFRFTQRGRASCQNLKLNISYIEHKGKWIVENSSWNSTLVQYSNQEGLTVSTILSKFKAFWWKWEGLWDIFDASGPFEACKCSNLDPDCKWSKVGPVFV